MSANHTPAEYMKLQPARKLSGLGLGIVWLARRLMKLHASLIKTRLFESRVALNFAFYI